MSWEQLPSVLVTSTNPHNEDFSVIKTHGYSQAKYWLKRAIVPSRHRNYVYGKTPLSFLLYPRMQGICIILSYTPLVE